jgi:hypothetical protein
MLCMVGQFRPQPLQLLHPGSVPLQLHRRVPRLH